MYILVIIGFIINQARAASTVDLVIIFIEHVSFANFCKIFFSMFWFYAVPYIGGFNKMNSYHMYKVYEKEAVYLEESIDSIYDK